MSRIIVIIGMVGLGWWLFSVGSWYTTATDEVYFFDIGQGDAGLLIKSTPCRMKVCEWLQRYRVNVYERTTVLIDGGPDDRIIRKLSQVLPWWKQTLDLVVLTHPHQDHLEGLLFVGERFRIRRVLMHTVPYNQSQYGALLQQWGVCAPTSISGAQGVARTQKRLVYPPTIVSANESMLEYPWLTVLLPLDDARPVFDEEQRCWRMVVRQGAQDTVNNDSVVIATKLGSKDIVLWAGDSEAPAEKVLLALRSKSLEELSPISILKAPHHCSRSASTSEFVSVILPKLVICSVGEGNAYGHPHREVVERYKQLGSEVWRTDTQGTKHVTHLP